MATTLNTLISDKTADKLALQIKVNDGEGAKVELSEVVQELDTLGEVKAIRDDALARAAAMVDGSQAAVGPLQSSAPYTSVSAAVDAAVIAKGKTEAGMVGVVALALPPPLGSPYATYAATLVAADGTLADDIADETAKRITLIAKRGLIDVRIDTLIGFATAIDARLSQAKAMLTTATLAAQSNSVAAAWWEFHRIKALLSEVTAATASTLITKVNAACDDYAAAYDDWVTARDQLTAAIAERAAAADDLAKADAQTLAALAAFVG